MANLQFEHIEPYVEGSGGDTGRTARLKLRRNFEKIKAWMDAVGSDMASRFLSRLDDDTAQGLITFLKGLQLGSGGAYRLEETGDGTLRDLIVRALTVLGDAAIGGALTTHDLTVTGTARFFELLIDEVRHVGGTVVLSHARMKTDLILLPAEGIHQQGMAAPVVWVSSSDIAGHTYPTGMEGHVRLLWLADDGDRQTGNQFRRGDQVLCVQSHMLTSGGTDAANKYWWKLVLGASTEPVEVSDDSGTMHRYHWIEVDAASGLGTMAAAVGDEVVALGWQHIDQSEAVTESQRALLQSAIILASGFTPDTENGVKAPCMAEYADIDNFTLAGHLVSVISPHGNMLTGNFTSSSGKDFDAVIDGIADGMSEHSIWFGSGSPTMDNNPASQWTTVQLMRLHEGDLYFDTDEEPASEGGASWRFTATDAMRTSFAWQRADDRYTVAALRKVQNVASDGIITGGAEKQGVLVEWYRCRADYLSVMRTAEAMALSSTDEYQRLDAAWKLLFIYLNHAPANDYLTVPYELSHISDSWTLPSENAAYDIGRFAFDVPAGSEGWQWVWQLFYQSLGNLQTACGNATGTKAEIQNLGDELRLFVTNNYTSSSALIDVLSDAIALLVSKNDLTQSGVELNQNGVTLTGRQILTQTPPENDGEQPVPGFRFIGSIGEVFNPVTGRVQMRFGYDADTGYMTLSYYDNDGNKLYDLGPQGLLQNVTRGLTLTQETFLTLTEGFGNISGDARIDGSAGVASGDASAIQAHLVYHIVRAHDRLDADGDRTLFKVAFPQVGGQYVAMNGGQQYALHVIDNDTMEEHDEQWEADSDYDTVYEQLHDGEYFPGYVSFRHSSSDHTTGIFASAAKVYSGTPEPSDYRDIANWATVIDITGQEVQACLDVDWQQPVWYRRVCCLYNGRVMGERNAYFN